MKPLRFLVEHVMLLNGRRVIFARRLDAGEFSLHDELRLSGHAVESFDIPRAVAADGTTRLDLFAFTLCLDDGADISPGQTTVLARNGTG